jgi:CelD/BcsL family acetyltransferase involved in cellulose biosynthesis
MPQATNTLADSPALERTLVASPANTVRTLQPADRVALSIHRDFAGIEAEWRRFEQDADATVFQSFGWLATWYRHVGTRNGVMPAIVTARGADGRLLFLLPLAVEPGLVRRLTFLGSDLSDYNAPLLARDFAQRVSPDRFVTLWGEIRALLQQQDDLRHDVVELTKMPETLGAQANPLIGLEVGPNPSGAHLTHLGATWDEYYEGRRSSATRRRDRTKRKKLSEHGAVRMVEPADADDIAHTLETLIAQKSRLFAHMGVANMFARPGCKDFYIGLATNPATRHLVHVSRLEVGAAVAAVNLGLTFRDTYYYILASYDDGELSRFGPGATHLRDLMQRAIERGFRHFDFTIGDERYKHEWADTSMTLYDHTAAASLRGRPFVIAGIAFRRLKRTIKQTPVLWRAFGLVRAAMGPLLGRRRIGEKHARERDTATLPIAPE